MKFKSKLSRILLKIWPYLIIFVVTSVYFIYLLNDSRYFFYDDFTALKFVANRSYLQIIFDSLASRNVDRHKFLGYLFHKFLYQTAGLEINTYFLSLFLLHTLNSFLVFKLLKRLTKKLYPSLIVTLVFAWRFYLWWFSNIHQILAGTFFFICLLLWLKFISNQRLKTFLMFVLSYLLAVFAYGPAVMLSAALIPFTIFYLGWARAKSKLKFIVPFLIIMIVYLFIFTFTADSVARFASAANPYSTNFTLPTFLSVHGQYLSLLSADLLPQSILFVIFFWALIFFITIKFSPRLFYLLLVFCISLLPNSFFANHTMFYYLYSPIVFILIFFACLFQEKLWPLYLAVFLAIFNPFHNFSQVAHRLRHPSNNFERQAMHQIVTRVDRALKEDQTQVKLSNWQVTPNLQHAIDYQVLPFFLTFPHKNNYHYSYSRQSQILTLTPKQP